MPIGATIGAGVITAGAGIYSSSQASKATSKAASQAADTSLAVANTNNALYREIYGQNKALLTPYSNMGLQAGNALSDLLLGTSYYNSAGPTNLGTPLPQDATGGVGPGSSTTGASGRPYTDAQIAAMWHDGISGNAETAEAANRSWDSSHAGALASTPVATASAPAAATGTPTGASGTVTTTPASGALDAWDRFRAGTNYQWRLNQGENALASGYASHGAFDSGAEKKALLEYGQNFASNELSNYMSLLAGQQSMGLSAAGAVAGVGTSYAGNVAAQNTSAANAAANAALASGSAKAGMWGSIGQGVGQLGGALFQYGMGQPAASISPAAYPSTASAIGNYGYSGGF